MAHDTMRRRTEVLRGMLLIIGLCILGTAMGVSMTHAQAVFDSGSDGSDGALTLTTPGTVNFFDVGAFTPPLDADGDGIYHFTTITIEAGVVVNMRTSPRGPVTWLATGDVQIDGTIDLNGEDGHETNSQTTRPAFPGAGGFSGGVGRTSANFSSQSGQGFGGGGISMTDGAGGGGGAGHVFAGLNGEVVSGFSSGLGGSVYGNAFLLPLLGGSGGAGGGVVFNATTFTGSGGGAGGGAILIASSTLVAVNGSIQADGGAGGGGTGSGGVPIGGGGGSGGSIRIMAPVLSGIGALSVNGGSATGRGGAGSPGRARLEAFQQSFAGSTSPGTVFSTPGLVSLPPSLAPVRVVAVGGVPVPASPLGSFTPADLVINAVGEITLDIVAQGVPVGTVVTITLISETEGSIEVESTPLDGTLEASTATAMVTIPHGFSRFFVQASFE